jgi:hypothetical protein
VKVGNFQIASYNDTNKFPFFATGEDEFWSAGLNILAKNGDLTLSYSFDLYYGLSDADADFDQDRIVGGRNFDNQNFFDILLNNGIEKISLQDANFGTLLSGSNTGKTSFWPSNQMHNTLPAPSFTNPKGTFHHLFVPYENGEAKPSSKRIVQFLNGKLIKTLEQ